MTRVTDANREILRTTFNEDAERYHRARPAYPPAMFDALVQLAGAGPGCRVLEIGAGTGKATLPLARLGCRIVAVELGEQMAAVARAEVRAFPEVQIEVAPFEVWPLPAEPFDLVLAATAFHWLDPAVRLVRAARALRSGGALAVIDTMHVAGGDVEFFREAQACYERFDPATEPGLTLQPASVAAADAADLTEGGHFGGQLRRLFEWELTYTTGEYIDLLLTYSGHRALPDAARTGLLDCIAGLIDTRYAGHITKRYLTHLSLAYRP